MDLIKGARILRRLMDDKKDFCLYCFVFGRRMELSCQVRKTRKSRLKKFCFDMLNLPL